MKLKFAFLMLVGAFSLSFSSCGIEQERQVKLPESDESVLPWNGFQEGEGQGQFGALQR